MSSLARMEEPHCVADADQAACAEEKDGVGYVSLIQHEMETRHCSLRKLELMTRINRARLGRVLHRNVTKRHAMTLVEFQTILRALDIDPIEALVVIDLIKDLEIAHDERYAKLAMMLSTLFRGLPRRLVDALHDIEGMDGSEIRQEWGTYFQSAVVNRMVHEVGQILERRARIAANNDPFAF